MEKNYKQVPFDIELAKKIQSGEVEGRLLMKPYKSGETHPVIILTCDAVHNRNIGSIDIVVLVQFEDGDVAMQFNSDGYGLDVHGNDVRLLVELPEEAPNQLNGLAGCDGQCHSCTNDCTQRKYDMWTHNFKVGDKVTISGSEVIWTIKEIKNDKALIFADGPCGCVEVELRKLKHYKNLIISRKLP